jgi:hypothetical protein
MAPWNCRPRSTSEELIGCNRIARSTSSSRIALSSLNESARSSASIPCIEPLSRGVDLRKMMLGPPVKHCECAA